MTLKEIFFWWGYNVSKQRKLTIIICILITCLISINLVELKIETNAQNLWVNLAGRTAKEQTYFNDHFGNYFRINQVVFLPKDETVEDVFTKDYLMEIYDFVQLLHNKTIQIHDAGKTLDDYCYKPIADKHCYMPSPWDYWHLNLTRFNRDNDIKYTAQCVQPVEYGELTCGDINGIPVIKEVAFGGIKCENGTGTDCEACRIHAKSLQVTVLLNNDDSTNDEAAKWEKEVYLDLCDKFNKDKSKNLHASYMAERSITDQLHEEASQNQGIIIISYVLMLLYVGVGIGKFPNRVHNGFILGISGIFVVIFSVLISFSICTSVGFKLNLISSEVVPFLILAIGVDNMFIIADAEKRSNIPEHEIPKVMAFALSKVGPSILVAAISEFAAFMVGVAIDIPALQSFCVMAAVAVLVDFMLQCTLFLAVLAYDLQRRRENRWDIIPCQKEEIQKKPRKDIIKHIIKNYYSKVITHPVFIVLVLVMFVLFLLIAFLGIGDFKLGMTPQTTVTQGSAIYNFLNANQKYGEAGPPAYIVLKNIDYLNSTNLEVLDKLADGLSQLKTVQPPVYSWVKIFDVYRQGKYSSDCDNADVPDLPLGEQVNRFKQVPIDGPCCENYGICGEQYQLDIQLDSIGNIVASRYRFQHVPLRTQQDYIDAFRDTRYAVDQVSPDLFRVGEDPSDNGDDRLAYAYSLFYVYYDQYTYIRGVALENFLLAIAVVLVCINLVTNLIPAVIVTLCIAAVTFDIVGLCYIWNKVEGGFQIEINGVSVVNLVTAVGLSVEFCVHIMTAFVKAKGTAKERVEHSLSTMGASVFVGIALTKFIGVFVLGFAPSKVFTLYYFRMYMCIVILGVFHGMAFLPVLLYLVGGMLVPPEDARLREDSRLLLNMKFDQEQKC